MNSTETCKWLHKQLEKLPLIRYPFDMENLPKDGIYFFYEEGEIWGHGGVKPRIVRIGTHKSGNFRSRIKDHFVLNEKNIENLNKNKSKPADRSIFRKNIGRALLKKENNSYIKIWEKDFIEKKKRKKFSHLRDIELEKKIERKVSSILRKKFSFRFLEVSSGDKVIGSKGLESSLIGTVAHCNLCRTSENWLGNFSPINKIKNSGLWLFQHLDSNSLNNKERTEVKNLVNKTLK